MCFLSDLACVSIAHSHGFSSRHQAGGVGGIDGKGPETTHVSTAEFTGKGVAACPLLGDFEDIVHVTNVVQVASQDFVVCQSDLE